MAAGHLDAAAAVLLALAISLLVILALPPLLCGWS
jgi:hypothetical protein